MTLLRVFRVRVHPGRGADYERFLREVGIPATREQAGAGAFWVGGPSPENPDEYVFVSTWRDRDALIAMRGEDFSDPGIAEDERDVIAHADVAHFEMWDLGDLDV